MSFLLASARTARRPLSLSCAGHPHRQTTMNYAMHQQCYYYFSAQPTPLHEDELDADDRPLSPRFSSSNRGNNHPDDDNIASAHYTHSRHQKIIPQEVPKIGRLILVRHGQSKWNVTDPTRNLTARFTGWADIGLTQQGKDQAVAAGKAIQLAVDSGILSSRRDRTSCIGRGVDNNNYFTIPAIDVVFCSLLKRSIDTMNILLEEIHLAEKVATTTSTTSTTNTTTNEEKDDSPKYLYPIPIIHSWRLNERHYGALVGLSKQGAERLYGRVRLTRWRDSWDVRPPPMPLEMVKRWGREDHCKPVTIVKEGGSGRMCVFDPSSVKVLQNNKHASQKIIRASGDERTSGMKIVEHGGKKRNDPATTRTTSSTMKDGNDANDVNFMPPSESLHDTYQRFLPLWEQGIAPHLRAGRTVLVVGHANTIRSMLFAIDGDVATKDNAKKLKIPSALPLVYELCDGSIDLDCFEVEDDNFGKHEGRTNGLQTESTCNRIYRLNNKECSGIVPGNLRVLKPPSATNGTRSENDELRHRLSGVWVETDETKSVSFCTDLGKEMGEQDIA